MNSSAPISKPSRRCSAVLNAVINIIGKVVLPFISLANSKPDPSGKPMSRMTRSHSPSFNFASALCLVSTHATSYFSRRRRSCKVAPSDRSSSTSNSRFIIGIRMHASSVLFFGKHARGVGTHGFGQVQLSHKAALCSAAKLNRAVHCFCQLTHDVKPNAAAAAARVTHEQFAELTQIPLKAAAVIDHSHAQASGVAAYIHINLRCVPVK